MPVALMLIIFATRRRLPLLMPAYAADADFDAAISPTPFDAADSRCRFHAAMPLFSLFAIDDYLYYAIEILPGCHCRCHCRREISSLSL